MENQLPEINTRSGSKKIIILVSIIVGLLIVGGAGALAYFKYSEPSPEEIIKNAIGSLYDANSFSYKGNITAEIEPGLIKENSPVPLGNERLALSLDIAGKFDNNDVDNIKNALILDLRLESLSSSLQVGMNFGIEFINIGQDLYLRATNIPPILPFDLTPLINQWIKTDVDDIQDQLPGEVGIEDKELSEGQFNEVKELIANSSVLKDIERLSDENINGVDTHHFRFQLDRSEIKRISKEIRRIQGVESTQQEITDFEEGIDNLNIEDNEVWIGNVDRLLHKVAFGFNLYQDEDNSQSLGRVSAEVLFDDYNKPMEITIPESTKTFEEVFSLLFADMFVAPEMEFNEVSEPDFLYEVR